MFAQAAKNASVDIATTMAAIACRRRKELAYLLSC
jgi:hypothetical protein